MHFHVEVWISGDKDPSLEIEEALAPFDENEGASMGGSLSWDWYQVGGRWKGVHIPEYDSSKDDNHIRECKLCEGTGKRTDMEVQDGCNGCGGTGRALDWPTQWGPHTDDIMHVSKIHEDLTCACLIYKGKVYGWDDGYGWDKPGPKVKDFMNELVITTGYLVTIDVHS